MRAQERGPGKERLALSSKAGNYVGFSTYSHFTRAQWAAFRDDTPLTLSEDDLPILRGINESLSLDEITEIYLPLARLLNLYVAASQELHRVTSVFLGNPAPKVPFIISLAGSVAVGKSTTARILQALLARWPNHVNVALITTDGFLYPNAVLEERGIMKRKGFPESYNMRLLVEFVGALKAGEPVLKAPVYSHLTYDVLPDQYQSVEQPDIVIIEGINVLQAPRLDPRKPARVYVSDFFDFSIYVDAEIPLIKSWFLNRFHALRDTAFRNENSYFHRYADMSFEEADAFAQSVWHDINERNLMENILPTRQRADLVLVKGQDHAVQEVHLRKL